MDVLATVQAALVGGPQQHNRLMRLHTPLGPEVLVAETLDGVEALAPSPGAGAGFRLQLTALSVDAHIDLAELLGQPVLLELLTAESAHERRPFHGHVSAFERLGSNGGLARYRLVIEPWLAFTRQRLDSYVFQDLSVVEIVESVFADYAPKEVPFWDAGQGKLVPVWRWDLADRAVYRKRSLTTQYEESDFAFVERLLAEEGIHYHFEHHGDAGSDSLGAHTLVLADHNDAFAGLGTVRFHRSDVTEREDSIQHWSTARRWQTTRLQRASWDYRSLDLRPTGADGVQHGDVATEDVDIAGPYAWPDRATGERYARQQLEALQVTSDTVRGAGSWRRLRPGGRFTLSQHDHYRDPDAAQFHCLRLHHRARNNLGAQIQAEIEQLLGRVDLTSPELPTALAGFEVATTTAGGQAPAELADGDAEAGFYRNGFDALPAAVPYRARTLDGHGLRLHPKPNVHGTQTAIVVSDGAPLQTDRDHRIKVQFAWQRGADASNRLAHPAGDDNAPGQAQAWTWVRVAGPWAGDNWGSVLIPRKGQEVLVAFLEGDIDRPVVIGALYNGRGQDDAAHNQVGGGAAGATGNAAAWFEGNAHPSVFTGFKTQMLADSQGGSGGYQQLRLDDTPGQGRAQASTTQHDSTLTLGHLKGGKDNVRGNERGFGTELSTQAGGALRAGAGLLLSTEPGPQQLSAGGAQAQLTQSEQLLQSLQDAAKVQTATLPEETATLPAQQALKTVQETLAATQSGSAPGDGIGGGDGEAPGWSAPMLVASSPAGVVSVTPADQVWVSGTQTVLSADRDLNWLSQGETVMSVAGGVALYTQGSPAPSGKPNQETGIALHAAQGPVSARAHGNLVRVAARTSVTIASTQADINVAASKHVLATAAGAYLKLEGGNIELGAPGTIEFKASRKEWTGPKSASVEAPTLAKGDAKLCEFKTRGADAGGDAVVPVGV
ncbi:type VI secretion system Vgr family protein [Lysobacter cavernae]|uniref:Type VI secretion system Vgr family protein n=1 Tax=Lysobacter cavernae TaxID=1685901 RepID=A0ABV7RU64_9GAMM